MIKRLEKEDWKALPLFAMVFSLPFKLIYAPIFLAAQLVVILFFVKKGKLYNGLILPFVLFLSYAMSVFYSADLVSGMSNLFMKLPLIAIPVIFMFIHLTDVNYQKLINLFIFSCFIFCIIAFIKLIYFTLTSGVSINNYNFVQQSIKYYHFPTEALMLNIALVLNIKSKIDNRLRLVFSLSFFLFILLSGTRIGLILSAPLFFWNLFNLTKHLSNFKKLFLFIVLPLIFVLIASQSRYTKNKILDSFHYIGLFTSLETESFSKQYHKINFREKLWEASINKIKASPILGYGIGVERQLIAEELSKNQIENSGLLNAHNQYLSTYISSGIFGVIILISWMFYLLYVGVSNKNFELIAITFVIILSMFVESYLERQKGVFLITFFLSLISKTHTPTCLNK